ncbi:MAG TPA: RNA polymerase subunit sigma-24 [Cytophagales bacterium]|nr:RNA polymerase subunit sigma-24 [Cytophagales bacterium]
MNPAGKDIEIIVEKCNEGDRKAQKAFYEHFAPQLYVVCLRYARTTLEADDMLQDSFVKIFTKLSDFRGESNISYWLKRIVVNTAINYYRNKLYMYPMVDVEEYQDVLKHEHVISKIQLDELLEMLHELPEGCRVIFNLYAIEGYKHQEIAEMLKISEGTSKSQFARARQLLQEMLRQDHWGSYESIGK